MTAVWVFLAAAVVGTVVYVYFPSWVRHWREANTRINVIVAYLQGLPRKEEDR